MGEKEEQIRPLGEESIPETPFGKAMREAVERKKREENPSYEGGNPKDAADVKKDLGQLGIIEKNYSPEEEKKLSRSRQGVIGAASKAKQAEKVGEQWYLSEELRKKAYQEMIDGLAKRGIKLDEKFRRFNWSEKEESKVAKRTGKVAEQKKKEAEIIEKEPTLSPKEEAEYNYLSILLQTMPDVEAGKPIEDDKLARKVVDLRREAERLGGNINQIRAEAERILIGKGLIKGKKALEALPDSTLPAEEIIPGKSSKEASKRKESLLSEELVDAGLELRRLATRRGEGGINEEQIEVLERGITRAQRKLGTLGYDEDTISRLKEKGPVNETAVKKILRQGKRIRVESFPEVSPVGESMAGTGEEAKEAGGPEPESTTLLEEKKNALLEACLTHLKKWLEGGDENSEEAKRYDEAFDEYFNALRKTKDQSVHDSEIKQEIYELIKAEGIQERAEAEVRVERERKETPPPFEKRAEKAESMEGLTGAELTEIRASIEGDWAKKMAGPAYTSFSEKTRKIMLEELVKATYDETLRGIAKGEGAAKIEK